MTEAEEVVRASNYLPKTMWLEMLLEGKRYILEQHIFLEDNKSAMKC